MLKVCTWYTYTSLEHGRNGRPSGKLNKILYEHHFCYTFSSALGDKKDHHGNEKKQYAKYLINARNVVIGNQATVRTYQSGSMIIIIIIIIIIVIIIIVIIITLFKCVMYLALLC